MSVCKEESRRVAQIRSKKRRKRKEKKERRSS